MIVNDELHSSIESSKLRCGSTPLVCRDKSQILDWDECTRWFDLVGLLTYTEDTGRGVGATLNIVILEDALRVPDFYCILFQNRRPGKISIGRIAWMDAVVPSICGICGFWTECVNNSVVFL